MENIKHELEFFEIAIEENFYKTLSFHYHMEIPMDYSIWSDLNEKANNFKDEIISNCTPNVDTNYLNRIKEKIISIKCDLSPDEKSKKIEESKVWDSENECYDFYKQQDLIELYDYVKGIKVDLLDFVENIGKPKIELINLFHNSYDYDFVMDLLITKGYCQKETHKWIKNGKSSKHEIASLFIDLDGKNYFTYTPSNEQRKDISINTLGVHIGIDTFKNASRKNPPKALWTFEFIPIREGLNPK